MHSIGKPALRCVSHSPKVVFPAPSMTWTPETDYSVDLRLASLPQEGEEQALDHLPIVLAEREYWNSVKDERKDIHEAYLSPTLYLLAFGAKSRPILLPLPVCPTNSSLAENPLWTTLQECRQYIQFKWQALEATNCKLEELLWLTVAFLYHSSAFSTNINVAPALCENGYVVGVHRTRLHALSLSWFMRGSNTKV